MKKVWVLRCRALLLAAAFVTNFATTEASAQPAWARAADQLSAEIRGDGGRVAFPANRLLPAALLGADPLEARQNAAVAFLRDEWESVFSAFSAGTPASACQALTNRIESTPIPGAPNGQQTRADDVRFFREHSASRSCWQNGREAMISELRQVFFVRKNDETTPERVLDAVSAFERSPNQAFELHYYEYPNPLDLNAGNIIASNRRELPRDPIPLDQPILIKKCLTVDLSGGLGVGVATNKYCNTMLHRAYDLGEGAFMLTTQLYNISLGDRTFTVDANGSRSGMADFARNTAHQYTAVYLVVPQGDWIAVHNVGLQIRNEACPEAFRRSRMQEGQVAEFVKLREHVERELGQAPTLCGR